MFVFPEDCKDFAEWINREIEETEKWAKRCKNGAPNVTASDDILQRAITIYRAETILENMKEIKNIFEKFPKS